MKSITPESAVIFYQLIMGLGNRQYRKFISDGYMPLSLELIGQLNCTFGRADAYSLSHHFTQNGDLMRDPEMCFLVMETNTFNNLPNQIFPYSYQLDPLGVYQESIEFASGRIMLINPNLQEQHASFASDWLNNIQSQGFLK